MSQSINTESIKEHNYLEFFKSIDFKSYDPIKELKFPSIYESQYIKNRDLTKKNYKQKLCSNLKVEELKKSLKYAETETQFKHDTYY